MTVLPRWDVTDVFPSLEDRSFLAAFEQFDADVARLEAAFDEADMRGRTPASPTAADARAGGDIVDALNAVMRQSQRLAAYVHSTVSTDSFDDHAQGLAGQLGVLGARVAPLQARLASFVASFGADALASLDHRLAEHVGPLRRLAARAEHQMPEPLEGLYAELATTGSSAWGRLHADVTSQLVVPVVLPDGPRDLPIAALRGLTTHPDPLVRVAAYDAELAAWPSVAVPCAAALNAIKGEANTVNRRRGWDSPLDASLFANSVARPTFDAMRSAITAALPDFRHWLRTKASAHGHPGGLPWWDLFAPVPPETGRDGAGPTSAVTWEHGLDVVRTAFESYGGALGGLVDRAVGERWIDAEPRAGKRGGAFCMSFVDDRSLVFLNWSGSLDSTQTTAHELGHAYHNVQLAARTPLQRMLPMALAETASIFCETLVVEHGLRSVAGDARLALLDVDLIGTTQVIVDIESRLAFETELFARRRRRTLGVAELNEVMVTAQLAAYGDGLVPDTAHPYMWAVKPHYYGSHFYNWPYSFGLLFGLGLFAVHRADPERFAAQYDEALSLAGMATAEELGARFGLDVGDEAFWIASLDVVRARIAEYDRLVADRARRAASSSPDPAR